MKKKRNTAKPLQLRLPENKAEGTEPESVQRDGSVVAHAPSRVISPVDYARLVARLADVSEVNMIGEVIRVTGRPCRIGNIRVIGQGDRAKNVLMDATFNDRFGSDEMRVVGLNGPMVRVFRRAGLNQREITLYARVANDARGYYLHVLEVDLVTDCLTLVGASPKEMQEAARTVERFRGQPEGLLKYIVASLVTNLGIVGLDGLSALQKALNGVVLQALSLGWIQRALARIHILLIGPSAVGKSIAHDAAQIINPAFAAISTNRVTPSGLTGMQVGGPKGSIVYTPGSLAKAAMGVASAQDIHHLDQPARDNFLNEVALVAQSGRMVRSDNRGFDTECDCAFLLDLNPASAVAATKKERDTLADVNVPVNILTRMDLICMFDRDVHAQIETMLNRARSIRRVGGKCSVQASLEARRLQVLVAYLRDTYREIDIPPAVSNMVEGKLRELFDANMESFETSEISPDFLSRGVNSIFKFIAASARLHGRVVAEEIDVKIAFEMYEETTRFISRLEPTMTHISDWRNSTEAREKRQEKIRVAFAGKMFSVDDVLQLLDDVVTSKTVYRDLEAIGAESAGHGYWEIPAQ